MSPADQLPYSRAQILDLFRPILARIDLGILFADPEGGILLCNEFAEQILGLDADEHRSEHRSDLRQLNGIDLLQLIEQQTARPGERSPHPAQAAAAHCAASPASATAANGCRDAIEFELQLGGKLEEPRFVQVRSGFVDLPCAQGHLRVVMLRDVTRVKFLHAAEHKRASAALLTKDSQMLGLLGRLRTIAPSDAPVLLQGESGTGKTVLAQSIHEHSRRASSPFVEVNCASIPSSLIESELFGHVKGAFTGASQARLGRFRSADGGTLFLDEINEFPLELQPKLLRVLQSGQFEPVGSDRTLTVDVRLITASNQSLRPLVDHGLFRADLFYRIAVIPIQVPPLRERPVDIQLLAEHFMAQLQQRDDREPLRLTHDSLRALLDYHWPGNVRELSNAIEHGVICAPGGVIRLDDLPYDVRRAGQSRANPAPSSAGSEQDMRQRQAIEEALHQAHGNRRLTAELLGIDRSTLWRRMHRLGMIDPN